MNRFLIYVTYLVVFAVSFPIAAIPQTSVIEKNFQGTWTPKNQSSCSAPIRVEVKKDTIYLLNKNDTATFTNLDVCYSCAGGAQYCGIEVYIFPEKEVKPSPFVIRFNPEEKKGLMIVEMQDLKLNRRFPFGKVIFKKCKK